MSTIVTRSGKGSALSHTEMDANFTNLNTDKLQNVVEDTSPQLGGTLDTNNKAIGNAGDTGLVDFEKRIQIDQNIADYSITVDNQNQQGLGLRIKAGDKDYSGSLAILSVADKNNVQQFIVKANGDINAAEAMTVGRAGTDSGTQGIISMVPGAITTLNASDDLNITTNNGVLSINGMAFPSSAGDEDEILKVNASGDLVFAENTLLQDTSPQLGGALDPKGQMIGPDSTRAFQIQGNQASPSSSNYDSFNNTNRVYGHVRVNEVTQPSNRVHSNPTLSLVTMTANAGSQNGRLRHNYFEAVLEMDGNNNTQTGFGRGHNGVFLSSMAKNSNTDNDASTLAQATGLTVSPQVKSGSTGGLTVTDMRAINMEPNINDSNGTVTNLYGLYYNTSNATGTITNQYSFYGAEQPATIYNAGGMELPSFTVANLTASSPVQVTRRTGNMVLCTNDTGGSIPAFWDGSNWRRMSDRAVVST